MPETPPVDAPIDPMRQAEVLEACRTLLAASSGDAGETVVAELGVRWAMQLARAEGAAFSRRHEGEQEWLTGFGRLESWRGRRSPADPPPSAPVPNRGVVRVGAGALARELRFPDAGLDGAEALVLPVGSDQGALGTLVLVSRPGGGSAPGDLASLGLLTGALGVALERARVLQRLARLTRVFDAGRREAPRVGAPGELVGLRRQVAFLKRSLGSVGLGRAPTTLEEALDGVLAHAVRLVESFEAAVPLPGALPERRAAEADRRDPPPVQEPPAKARGPRRDSPELDRGPLLELLAQGAPVEQALFALVTALERTVPGALVAVWRVRGGLFRFAAGRNLPRGYVQALDGADLQADLGVPLVALGTQRPVIAADLRAEGVRDPGPDHGLRACWAVGVARGAKRSDAVLTLHFRQPREPSEAERAVLAEAALLAGIALAQWEGERRLQFQAEHDPVTGLPNRVQAEARLAQALATARAMGQPLAVALVDLDNFKVVNESLGLAAGDALLRVVAQRLGACVRSSDLVARLGGDEFALILPLATDREAGQAAHRILRSLSGNVELAGQSAFVSASVGLALFPEDGDTAEALLRAADSAMHEAKRQGRARYQFFTASMRTAAEDWLALVTDLHLAVPERQLVLHYQPKVDLASGRVTGAEALVRWQHPRLGLLAPNRFLDLAEQTGLIMDIGRWVIEDACREARRWHDAGLRDLRVSVNLSAHQFRDDDLTAVVSSALARSGLAPEALELEITENMLMHDIDSVISHMDSLKRLGGVKLAIDDFGTGYSSLNYLKRFPVDSLKIDRSFLFDLKGEGALPAQDVAIIKTIVTLGQSLGLTLVAEGVETTTHLELLRGMRCDEIQGYFVSRPVPAPSFVEFVRSGAAAQRVAPLAAVGHA